MKLLFLFRHSISSLLVLCLGTSQFALAAELPLQAHTRNATSLNGEWRIIVDPYENGYYNYRWEPFDQQETPSSNAFFTDSKPRTPSDLIEYDFDKADILQVPGDWNTQKEKLYYYEGSIWYRRKFDAPAAKQSDRQFIYFGAVNYRADVYLNGKKLGVHVGGFTPFHYEVTGKLKSKDNSLIIKVDNKRHADEVPTLNTDWWNYGGLTGSVSLEAAPAVHVVRADVVPHLDAVDVGLILHHAPILAGSRGGPTTADRDRSPIAVTARSPRPTSPSSPSATSPAAAPAVASIELARGTNGIEAAPLAVQGEPPAAEVEPTDQRVLETARGFAEVLVLEQATNQLRTGVFELTRRIDASRHQHLRLDADQQCGHLEELARAVQPEAAYVAHGEQKLLCDLRDRDIEDVDVLLADQMQQQLDRAGETLQLDEKVLAWFYGCAQAVRHSCGVVNPGRKVIDRQGCGYRRGVPAAGCAARGGAPPRSASATRRFRVSTPPKHPA